MAHRVLSAMISVLALSACRVEEISAPSHAVIVVLPDGADEAQCFSCQDGETILPPYLECDGTSHCPDDSDEHPGCTAKREQSEELLRD